MANISAFGTAQAKTRRHRGQRKIQFQFEAKSDRFRIQTTSFPIQFAENDVEDFNQQFVDILEELRLQVQTEGLTLSETDRDHYLERMIAVGEAAFSKILPDASTEYINTQIEKAEQKNRQPSLSFLLAPSFSLLWEMMYEGDTFNEEPDPALLWGFRYPLGRIFHGSELEEFISLQQGAFAAIHTGLTESRKEFDLLSQHIATLCDMLNLNVGWQLLDQIFTADNKFSDKNLVKHFNSEEFRFGLVHFACHCENPEEAGASQAHLSLTVNDHEVDISLGSLLKWRKHGFRYTPFVFLNACGSATLGHVLQTISFPAEFLNFGAGGVIATACTVPDNFASAFAAKFYKILLHKDQDNLDDPIYISEALLETRRYFLEHYNNPLGLAYGLYALANQQLELED